MDTIKKDVEKFTKKNIEGAIHELSNISAGFPNKSIRVTVENIIEILKKIHGVNKPEEFSLLKGNLDVHLNTVLKIEMTVSNLDLLQIIRKLKSSGYIDMLTWALAE